MSTATMERPLMEMSVSEIDFSTINPVDELRKIKPRFMERYDKLNGTDKATWLRSYEVQSPVEEALLQLALDGIEPSKLGQTEESKVRQEMAELAAKGVEIDSPEMEAEWEAKLQSARLKDRERAAQLKKDRAAQFGINGAPAPAAAMQQPQGAKIEMNGETSALSDVKGIGPKSLTKLHDAGITTVEQFRALDAARLTEICGNVVAIKFFPKNKPE